MCQKRGSTILLLILYTVLIAYLVLNTGLVSDDFCAMISKNKLYFIETPVQYLTNYIWYPFFSVDNAIAIGIVKTLFMLLSFYLCSFFFSIYMEMGNAFMVSFFFLFFPTHDSTVYFFMSQYLTLSFSFYLFAFYLAYKSKLKFAFLAASIASFVSYGSTPIAVALFSLFVLNKELKKGIVIIIPNIVYALYFSVINIILRMGSPRIIEDLNISSLIKQFALQVLTFFDSMIGPSFWLKIYYAFSGIGPISFIIGIILTALFYKLSPKNTRRYDMKILTSFVILLVLAFVMFSFTGRYPQMSFGLGNRVTIFGSLLLVYLLVLLPAPKVARTLICALLTFSILGISDHWKFWNLQQEKVIITIKNNPDLRNFEVEKLLFVSGNQYSKYGPISHIEFFSESWVPSSIFKLTLNKNIRTEVLNRRFRYSDGYIIDIKYGFKMSVQNDIEVYDSEKNSFSKLKRIEINSYIDSLPKEKRHWLYLWDIAFIKQVVFCLMPRLKYAFL